VGFLLINVEVEGIFLLPGLGLPDHLPVGKIAPKPRKIKGMTTNGARQDTGHGPPGIVGNLNGRQMKVGRNVAFSLPWLQMVDVKCY